LALVETFAGLGGPAIPAARRIAAMQRRLAGLSSRTYFWSASFAVDPWAVSREILRWRDALTDAGWHANAVAHPPPRLADLAELETLPEPPLPPGMPDRLIAATDAVGPTLDLPFDEVVVIEDRAAIPPGINRLLQAIATSGVGVVYRPTGTGASSRESDLARVQSWLAAGKKEPLVGDGTFVVLQGRSEGSEAEALADWLAVGSKESETVVVLDAETGLLDGALSRRSLPRFVHLPASPLRGAIQVLSLAFAMRWRPFDPSPLLDLLSLPRSPVPGAAARPLAATLTEAPGRDGPRWLEAIEQGLRARRERFEADGLTGTALDRRTKQDTEQWLPWLTGELFDETVGMPAAVAREICGRVTSWSARISSQAEGPVAAVASFATTLSQVIQEAGLDPLPRVQLERMIDAVIADGVDAEHAAAEASPWSHVTHPAQLWGEAGTVVWWGCGSDGAAHQPSRWTLEEKSALQAALCAPEETSAVLARESAGWRRALLNAQDRVLLVVPPGSEGGEGAHPLLHELAPLISASPAMISFKAERVFATEVSELAGRSIFRTNVPGKALPVPRGIWKAPAESIKPRAVEAATSIELLLGCPFAWSLRYPGKLRPSRRSAVPKGETLLGLLAHALAAEIFKPGAPPTPDNARGLAAQRLPALIDEMASPLRLPGAAADYARVLSRLPVAMAALATRLGELKATIVGPEAERQIADSLGPGIALNGRIDLLIETKGKAPAVIDMKWSRSDRRRRDEIVAGRSVQLAVYGRILGSDSAPAPGAYFMLSQARFLPAGDNLFGAAAGSGAPTLASVWESAKSTWQARMKQLDAGRVDALGESLREAGEGITEGGVPLDLEPPCRFCDKSRLCGQAVLQ
jgi:RecB family exonuclease